MSRSYPALDITSTPDDASVDDSLRDRLLAALDDLLPTAIQETPNAWRVFFESAGGRDAAASWLRTLADPRISAEKVEVPDEDWARRSQADLQPVSVGTLVITPPWAVGSLPQQMASGTVIVVVPSTGFGTGHHASTRLCLRLLQTIPTDGRSVLDVGTGSGVLALAAARLGASRVTAIDNDPDALEAARENVSLNHLGDRVQLELADLKTLSPTRADIVTANLTGDLLSRTAAQLAACVEPGGHCIVSGVLAVEEASVASAFESAGAKLAGRMAEEEWVGLVFTSSQISPQEL